MPLEVSIPFRPGKQSQRARRVAVGELLAALGVETATVDASGEDQVRITTPEGIWVIGEGGPLEERRAVFRTT